VIFSILSLSASPDSLSRKCAAVLDEALTPQGHDCTHHDIRDLPPAWVTSDGLDQLPPAYRALYDALEAADAVYFLLPVYCFNVSSPAKAIFELVGAALFRKPVAFVVAAGSDRSYLAVGNLMLSMMFERQTFCFPSHVLVTAADLLPGGALSDKTHERLRRHCTVFVSYAQALRPLGRNCAMASRM
jgi:NAD(P)H-dependent FMN reductase